VNQRLTDTPEQVGELAPEEKRREDSDPTDRCGRGVIAMIHKAANLRNDSCDRAMTLAREISVQLRAAEDRINQLQAEIEHFRYRAARAEGWLQVIQKEIEERLIVPRAATRPEQTSPR
jgi:hypothetical protein